MAQIVPENWKAGPVAREQFRTRYKHWYTLAECISRKFYNLPGVDRQDLIQTGLLAGAFALDTADPERGAPDAYVSRVMTNAMNMVACEVTAQCRHPRNWEQNEVGKWEYKPARMLEDVENVRVAAEEADEVGVDELRARVARRRRMAEYRVKLDPVAQRVFDLRTTVPAGLMATARNLMGRRVSDLTKIPNAAIAAYAGLTQAEVVGALRTIRLVMGGAL